jgi:hypothetical protein
VKLHDNALLFNILRQTILDFLRGGARDGYPNTPKWAYKDVYMLGHLTS